MTVVSAQTPARDAPRTRTGTASIAGVVTRADGPKGPLRRARVTVSGGGLTAPRIDTTDDNGRFEIGGLPAGEYSIAATKAAYLPMNYGASRPNRQGTAISLADGQRAGNLSIALPRGAVIAGTVTNGAGEPMSSVYISLLHRRIYNGERRWIGVATAGFTNDRGEYRAYGLQPGEYLVVTQAFSDVAGPTQAIRLFDADIDRVLQEARMSARPNAATSPGASTSSRPAPLGFAPVFHPGTANGALATTVVVGPAEERTGIDVRLDLVPMARIDGTVPGVENAGLPNGMQVVLTSLGPPAPWEEWGGIGRLAPKVLDQQGRFTFVGVPPGEYSLLAQATPQRGAGRGGVPLMSAAPASSPVAYATVAVNGDDQRVTLTLQPGIAMSGRFAFDGTSAPTALPGARLMLEDLRIDQSGGVQAYQAEPAADGAFRISNILPSTFKISNETRPGLALASGWAITSISGGGRELLDAPFELRLGDNLRDVVVTLTDHPSELTGTLQGPAGTPTSSYFIVVFAVDRQFWFPNSRRIISARPNTSGAYAVRNLPPGEYFIAAVTDVEDGEWFDPEFLRALLASSPIKIAITDGEKKRQDLRIGR